MPPKRIGRYEIVGLLGTGGMGSVHLAYDPNLDREIAVKLLRGPALDQELRARFLREARATANLHHSNIVTIFEVGQEDDQLFIAMEYVAGQSLGSLIAGHHAVPLTTKLTYLEQICAGLAFAHAAGVVHRDVKPANLMVDAQGIVRILDFGIARLEGSGMTLDGSLIGTVNYMSPEQMLGRQVDHRSDIFAVGAVAHELLSYCQAFPGTLEELLQRLPNEAAAPLRALCPDIDPVIESIVGTALEKQPDRRFPNLTEMRDALADARQRVLAERGSAFVLATPAAIVGLASTLRRGPISSLDEDDLRSELQAASRCLESGDAARAAELAQRVIDRAPSSVEAHAILVRARRAMIGAGLRSGAHEQPEARSSGLRRRAATVAAVGAGLAVATATAALLMGAFSGSADEVSIAAPPIPIVPPAPAEISRTVPDASPSVVIPAPAKPESPALEASARESLFTEALAAAETEAERMAAGAGSTGVAPPIVEPPPVEIPAALDAPADFEPEPAPPVAPTLANPAPPAVESAPSVAAVNPVVRERPAILAALEQYRAAYQSRSIEALKAVYPTLSGEQLQARERAFKDKKGCRALDVRFGDPVVSLTDDATVAHVNVMSTYVCTPVTGQAKPQEPLPDLFQMRKQGDAWVIAVMGAMGQR
jgi:serine/threonine-protein kinase